MTASTAQHFPYGMNQDLTAQVVRLLAANVDFQAQLKSTDMLEAVFSVTDDEGRATDDSELPLCAGEVRRHDHPVLPVPGPGRRLDRLFRRKRQVDPPVPSAQSVPNGRFTSGFGMRRHPILGYSRMHTGVDWAAPRGTPIIASGNGTVEKAGWASGYGNQTMIRHANGYVTSYNHQSGIAKGITPGAKDQAGPGHRLCRFDRLLDRFAPALRADRQRHQGGRDEGSSARRQGSGWAGARLLPAGKAADRHAPAVRRSPGPGREPLRR
ncbi:hypothetical protein KSW81_001150 [Nannochloris sp. 'desiccata']|nr:hypothetical protein KSW81_001150 [Chlorella desiccata (nom. nud.)]